MFMSETQTKPGHAYVLKEAVFKLHSLIVTLNNIELHKTKQTVAYIFASLLYIV